ncbi:polyprenyl synthetase family protein [Streptomyces sp. NPDC048527]|uniref:polyprenyl synthetase family protein n=1 Tax=Streptomyces sp. NPDC048527 TaxID=3365568 RepID=UPI003718C82B
MSTGPGTAPTTLPPPPSASPLDPTLHLLRAELERRCPANAVGVDAMGHQAMLPAGKLLRPLLFTEAAAAVGMRREDTLTAALGVESLHVGSLVHDDIIDGDDLRRGRPTVVARHGLPNAIVTGDALICGAFRAVAECADGTIPGERQLAVVRVLADAGVDLCRGQAMEDELRGDPGCGLDRYMTMIELKTGALFRAACLGGALLAGASPGAQAALTRFAEHLGRAFQMTDDLLPHTSDTETSGKSVLSDIGNGRPTLPVLICWQRAGASGRERLTAALSGAVPADAALDDLRAVLSETGALEQARAETLAESRRASSALLDLPDTTARDTLAAVADLSVNRGL